MTVGQRLFIRGDCNGDLEIDLSDVLRVLFRLHESPEDVPSCADACDTNADAARDVTDAIYLLNFAFFSGPPPPPPFPQPGPGCGLACARIRRGGAICCAGHMPCPLTESPLDFLQLCTLLRRVI